MSFVGLLTDFSLFGVPAVAHEAFELLGQVLLGGITRVDTDRPPWE